VGQAGKISDYTDFATDGAAGFAQLASIRSQLPGRASGPADMFRHLLFAAEFGYGGYGGSLLYP
jgi:hypothetical protein